MEVPVATLHLSASFPGESFVIAPLACEAVLYAKHLGILTEFYQQLLGATAVRTEPSYVVLSVGGVRLWIHAIPEAIAMHIPIAHPPELREESAVKLSFLVSSLVAARDTASALGGGAFAPERAWQFDGVWHLDAWDPEGNVLQLRSTNAQGTTADA